MQPDDITQKDLAIARFEQASKCLQAAEVNIAANDFKTAANRSYYCIYHSMRTVLAFDTFDSKK
ncbi:MAG: HEPN domain-containing protein, partial [Chitinispirillales bacterium]|nr:HEPN domain-containing protein [Chitinispirillales bacterium]